MAYYSAESGVETDQDTRPQEKLRLVSVIPNKMVYNTQDKIALIFNKDLPSRSGYRVEFKGRKREKMEVKAHLINKCTLIVKAPVYSPPEKVQLHVRHITHEGSTSIGQLPFEFLSRLDVIGSLLQDCTDPVTSMCEALGISSNDMVALDKALTVSFKANMPPGFHLLGLRNYDLENETSDSLYPTLLHFAAAFGLYYFTKDCLCYCPGVAEAIRLRNCNNQRPSEIASKGQYQNLHDLFASFEESGEDCIYEPINENETDDNYYITMACQRYINLQLWQPNDDTPTAEDAQHYEDVTTQDEADPSGYVVCSTGDDLQQEEIYADMECGVDDNAQYTDVGNPSQHLVTDDNEPGEDLYMNMYDTEDTEPSQTTGSRYSMYDYPSSNLPVCAMYPAQRSISISLERKPDILKPPAQKAGPPVRTRGLTKEERTSPFPRTSSSASRHSVISTASSASGTSGSTISSGFEADNEFEDSSSSSIFVTRIELMKQMHHKDNKTDKEQSEAQHQEDNDEEEETGSPPPVPIPDYGNKLPPPPPGTTKPKVSNRKNYHTRSLTVPVNPCDVASASLHSRPASFKDNKTRSNLTPRPISDLNAVPRPTLGPRRGSESSDRAPAPIPPSVRQGVATPLIQMQHVNTPPLQEESPPPPPARLTSAARPVASPRTRKT